jgi:hypothetical protein
MPVLELSATLGNRGSDQSFTGHPRRHDRVVGMTITAVSIVLAAISVVAASIFYSFQIWNKTRIRRTDLLLRLYGTWDTLEFQEAFHRIYWADFHEYDSFLDRLDGQLHVGSYVATFYDQVGALLRRNLIDYDLVDDHLGNSAIQLWEKIRHVIAEARTRSNDPRLYEHFEFLYDEMSRRAPDARAPSLTGAAR